VKTIDANSAHLIPSATWNAIGFLSEEEEEEEEEVSAGGIEYQE
jgi:hypothetical protein